MSIPWWRILNLVMDVIVELMAGRRADEVAKRADQERSAMKGKTKKGGT